MPVSARTKEMKDKGTPLEVYHEPRAIVYRVCSLSVSTFIIVVLFSCICYIDNCHTDDSMFPSPTFFLP